MKLFQISFVPIFAYLLLSCQSNGKSEFYRNGYRIETVLLNDSLFDGETKYFDSSGRLKQKLHFKNGILDGNGLIFYSNGVISNSFRYLLGLKHGTNSFFNDSGNLILKESYYLGRRVGGVYYFQNAILYRYDFITFDGNTVFTSNYDSSGKLISFTGDPFHFNVSWLYTDGNFKLELMLFKIEAPMIRTDYSVGIIDSISGNRNILFKVPKGGSPFLDTSLNPLTGKLKYFMETNVYDSLIGRSQIFIQPF